MKIKKNTQNEGVSPVVGVMLMLVITIIIAAVVSGFSGGLMNGQEKAPSITADVAIGNGGAWGNSFWRMDVSSVDTPIPTKDLKIVCEWKANGTSKSVEVTGPATGDATVYNSYSALGNTHYKATTGTLKDYNSPLGYGPGVAHSVGASYQGPGGQYYTDQHWGNYTLTGGTTVYANPNSNYGAYVDTRYTYTETSGSYTYDLSSDIDPVQAILGENWWYLRAGDTVNVKLVHIPTGKVIFESDVVVQETG